MEISAVRYSFGPFILDAAQYRLTDDNRPVSVEPKVFDLLVLLVANAGEVVDRDQMVAEVWDGRIVSEATLSTAIKSARQALGDSGAQQSFIETVRGRGFRFAAEVARIDAPQTAGQIKPDPVAAGDTAANIRPPAVAVLPFIRIGDAEAYRGVEEAIPHDVILMLARFRSLFVIARGSSFQFRGSDIDMQTIGQRLNVEYCVTGTVEVVGDSISIGVELCDVLSGRVLWGQQFSGALDQIHDMRGDIVAGVAASLDSQIQINEAIRAQGRAIEMLDAWQAFHLGLKNVHLYTAAGNAEAEDLFRRAIALQPDFARAHAGLSYAHFQNAFMGYTPDRDAAIAAAQRAAETALEHDPMDPYASFNMGRTYWLTREMETASHWLTRAIEICPNYAQGIYSRAVVDTFVGRSDDAIAGAGLAMALSPLDPLLYAMRSTTALANVTKGDYAEAARWADAGARTPRAHILIQMTAVACHTLNGDDEKARAWAEKVRHQNSRANQEYYFNGLPMMHPESHQRLAKALAKHRF